MEIAEGTAIDRYVVEGLVGRGGMATVYRVRHTHLGTLHALKVLALHAPGLRERMMLEGRVQAHLQHPNVLSVTDVVDAGGGAPGLLMELVHGCSLDDLLRAVDPLPPACLDPLVAGMLAGVGAAHVAGVVHRDLKPANILLSIERGTIVPKVADFGLVKVFGDATQGATRSGTAMGTPGYMAPEQVRSAKTVDARADVFALGCILYELVTGRRAFVGESTYEIFDRVTRGSFVPVRDAAPGTPERQARAVEAALRTVPDERPPSCAALWELWSGGTSSLQDAAEVPGPWPPGLVVLLDGLASAHDALPVAARARSASGTFGTPAPPAGPAPSSRAPVVVAVGTAALVLFGIGAMVAVVLSPGTVPAPPATVARPQEVVSDPAGTTDPEPAAPEVDEPVDAPVALPPRPPPSVPAGEVVIVGDADAVQLVPVAGGPERRPGAVPVGRYSVVAVFGGAETRTGLVIDVRSGVQVVLRCSSGLRNCAIDATPRTSRP